MYYSEIRIKYYYLLFLCTSQAEVAFAQDHTMSKNFLPDNDLG